MLKDKVFLSFVVSFLFLSFIAPNTSFATKVNWQKSQAPKLDDLSLASILYDQREYEQSKVVLESILSNDPNNKKAKMLLGKVDKKLSSRRIDKKTPDKITKKTKTEYVNLNTSIKPKETELILGGNTAYKKGVLELNRSKVEDYYLFGETYYKQGEYEKAAAKFRRILNLDPTDKRAMNYYLQAKALALEKIKAQQPAEETAETIESSKAKELLDKEQVEANIENIIKTEELVEKGLYDEYKLGPSDEVQVTVVGQGNMSGILSVEQDGTIRMPVINEKVKADGLTATQLAEELEKALEKYVKKPNVVVRITKYESKKFYVIGQVGRPNSYPMRKNYLRLIDCLYEASLPLFNKGAAPRRVKVIKPHPVYPIVKKVNALDVLMEGKYKDNVIIEPGDTIYVPWTVVAKTSSTVSDAAQPVDALLRPVYYIRTIKDWNNNDNNRY